MKKKITLFLAVAFLSSLNSNANGIKPKGKLPDPVQCAVPENVVVTDITATSANFSWTPISGNLATYFYQYCVVATQAPEDGPTNPSGVTGSSYFPLTPNTTYYVYVRSFCDGGVWSDWSQPATFSTSILSAPGFAFTNFSAVPNPASNSVTLSNNAPISSIDIFNALGQNIYSQKNNDLNAEVTVSGFSKGCYFMTVHSGEAAKTIRLIKE